MLYDAARAVRVVDGHGVDINIPRHTVDQNHRQLLLIQLLIKFRVIAACHQKAVDPLIQKIVYHGALFFGILFAVDDNDLFPVSGARLADACQQAGRLAVHDVGHHKADQAALFGFQTVCHPVGTVAGFGNNGGDPHPRFL